jgi:phosphoserine aminotransferase
MTELTPPARKPARPFFSSGPCAKPPGWSPEKLQTASLGRSHRSKLGKARLAYCIDLMRELLELPDRIRHRRGGDGDVVAARRARRHSIGMGELR